MVTGRLGGRRVVQVWDLAMAICPRAGCERTKLIGSARRIFPAREQQFVLDLEQAGFDRVGTTKSPQETC
jgi:hypothetical protein